MGQFRHIRVTQLDGKLPNLALIRMSVWNKARGDVVAGFVDRRAHAA